MSLGSIIGGIAGGVIGFFVGGPMGAVYGASLGFGVGMMIDPMTPDIPTVGIPDPGTQVMQSKEGVPLADALGTVKITGHLLAFGGERNEATYAESSGGGGKGGQPEPQPQITGYKYYMSWVLGLCACPGDDHVNTLYSIYKNDDTDPVWSGELECPASGGEETIILDGIGSISFYFGTDDQMPNSKVAEIITDATLNTPYRNMCWVFFDDCYIGEYNRTPTYKFVIKKIPVISFSIGTETIQKYDINPAHAMWYILHNLGGLPTEWLSSSSFSAISAALRLEYRGVSILLDKQQSVLSYIETINGHIDCILRYGADAKFHPKLIRDDYDMGSLPTIDESVMLDDPGFSRGSWIDTVNGIKVQYSELTVERDKDREFEIVLGEGGPFLVITWSDDWGAGKGRFVAAGDRGIIEYSDDGGYTWQASRAATGFIEDTAVGATTHNSRIIITGHNRISYSDDGGSTWTVGNKWKVGTYDDGAGSSIIWNEVTNRYIVATYQGGGGSRIYTSTDLIDWEYQDSVGIYTRYAALVQYKGDVLIYGWNYDVSFISNDALNAVWETNPNPPVWDDTGSTDRGQAITDGKNVILYSGGTLVDGITWVSNGGIYWSSGDYSDTFKSWVVATSRVIGGGDPSIRISNDGVNWTNLEGVTSSNVPYDVVFGNDRFVAVTDRNVVYIGEIK